MVRSNALVSFAATAFAVSLVLAGCASGGGDAPSPAAPAKAPFTPPSYEAEVYENADLGFSIHYPADFMEEDAQGGLFTAASPQQIPRVDVALLPSIAGQTVDQVGELVKGGYAQIGGGEATLESSQGVTLQDGVTPAMEFVVDWSFQGFPIKSVALIAAAGDQAVQVSVTWAEDFASREDSRVDEIAYSLYFD